MNIHIKCECGGWFCDEYHGVEEVDGEFIGYCDEMYQSYYLVDGTAVVVQANVSAAEAGYTLSVEQAESEGEKEDDPSVQSVVEVAVSVQVSASAAEAGYTLPTEQAEPEVEEQKVAAASEEETPQAVALVEAIVEPEKDPFGEPDEDPSEDPAEDSADEPAGESNGDPAE